MKNKLTTVAWVQASVLNNPATMHLPAWKKNYTHLEDTSLVLQSDAQALLDAQAAEIAALRNLAQVAKEILYAMQGEDLMREWHTDLEEAISKAQVVQP